MARSLFSNIFDPTILKYSTSPATTRMPSNKNRLHVALHARGGAPKMPGKEDTYHWSLIVGPKNDIKDQMWMRYHAKQEVKAGGIMQWTFEEAECPSTPTNMLLVRVVIGKIQDGKHLVDLLRGVPTRQDQEGWNCVFWVKEALETLVADGKALGTNVIEWERVRDEAMAYCQRKKDAHRFDGKGDFDMSTVPTYDLIEKREIVP